MRVGKGAAVLLGGVVVVSGEERNWRPSFAQMLRSSHHASQIFLTVGEHGPHAKTQLRSA